MILLGLAYIAGLPLKRVQAIRLCTFFIALPLFLAVFTSSIYAQEGTPISGDKHVNPVYLPFEDAIAAQEAMEELIAQRGDVEESIEVYFLELKGPFEDKCEVCQNEDGLPTKIIYPDGTVVDYDYTLDENGELASVRLFSEGVNIEFTSDGATIYDNRQDSVSGGGASSDSPEADVVIEPEEGEIPLDSESLIDYGMIDFGAVKDAFERLNNEKETLKERYGIGVKAHYLESEGGGDQEASLRVSNIKIRAYRREMKRALNKFYGAIYRALKGGGLSSYRIKEEKVEALFVLPEKMR